jgi:predicted nucleic acid-binding protein
MRLYVAVTDKDWFALHASKPEVEEVNFWRPSPDATFKASWLELELRSRFAGRILPIDGAVADGWGLVADEAKPKGSSLSAIDGLLAATALQHNLTIVSRNVADFENTPAPILNPWEA